MQIAAISIEPIFNHPHTQWFYFLSLLNWGRNRDKQTWQNHCRSEAISKTKLATELCFKYVLGSQKQSSSKFLLKQRRNCTPVPNSHITASICLQLCLWRIICTHCSCLWKSQRCVKHASACVHVHPQIPSGDTWRTKYCLMQWLFLTKQFSKKPQVLEKVAWLGMKGQKQFCKIILEHHEQRKQNWMLPADSSKVM